MSNISEVKIELNKMLEKFKKTETWNNSTELQREFYIEYFSGHNIFLSGPAGVGKSFALQGLCNFLSENGVSIGITATTGVASFNIKGQTIHSWAGVGIADDDEEELVTKVKNKRQILEKIMATHTLVIDEISMAKPDLLNKLDYVFKILRFDRSAFGGLQIIFCGDFLQLPPVWKHDPDKEFAFNARSWKESNLKVVYLTEIVRQHNDPIFANLLNELRVGDVSNIDILKSKIDFKFPEDGIDPVYVCCKNVDVDKLNSEMLKDVVGVSKTFKTKDVGSQYHIDFFNKNCPVPEKLELKIGAQVMLLKNIDANNGLVNGSIGKILKYLPDGVLVKFKHCEAIIPEQTWELKEQVKGFGNKTTLKVVASRTQIPLRIAYAITVHKSQGATLDRAIIDVSEAFADGQIYVALSRVRDLDSLSVTHFSPARIKVNKECLDYYQNLK